MFLDFLCIHYVGTYFSVLCFVNTTAKLKFIGVTFLKYHCRSLEFPPSNPRLLFSACLRARSVKFLENSLPFVINRPEKVKLGVGEHKMGDNDDSFKSNRVVFVTVGTTCFDSLVRTVDTQEVREALFKKGYTHLVIQMGRGSYIPIKSTGEDGSLSVDYFTFSSSIAEFLKSASLVISHAGSGSIFETLQLRKPLIVVVNEDLMDNHQSELAEELAERNHLFCARPQTLYETISAMDPNSLVAYQPGDATPVTKFINRFLGFTEE